MARERRHDRAASPTEPRAVDPTRRLVALGAITRPHGVRGQVRVFRYNPDSTLLIERDTLLLRGDDGVREVEVEAAALHGKVIRLSLSGVGSREEADALRGLEVCVPRDNLPEPEEGEHYHVDLIGLTAVDPEGAKIGVVSEVIRYPASDCLLVDGDRRWEVPFASPYVGEIDLDAGRIVLAHLEDLA